MKYVFNQIYNASGIYAIEQALKYGYQKASASPNNKKAAFQRLLLLYQLGMYYSTVTDLAKFLGWSTLHPRMMAIW